MKNTILKRTLTMVVLCGILLSSVNMIVISKMHSSPKQYVVISKTDDNCSVNTYNMTPYEASKMKLSNGNILIVEEDGYVKGSQIQNKKIWKEYKTQKNKHDKKVIIKSSKDSKTEWNIQTVKANDTPTQQGQKVKVAIIDSGIDYTTDIDLYLRKNFIPGEDEIPVIYEDITGHGTSVAGIIAAKDNDDGITGINPNVELYSARVLDSNLSAPISRVVEAIYWAIDNDVNIINMSFGTTTDSEALRLAIQDAYNAGILIVAAAGNNGVIEYPAAYDEVIAVGSVDTKGDRSDSSATGEELELMAPGEQILSTGGFGGVAVTSGTSMASPHIAAIASALWQKDLTCSSDFIRTLMDQSANKYGDDTEYGYGLVDLEFALEQYDELKAIYNNSMNIATINEAAENGTLQENQEDVIAFNDVTYVEGSWYSNEHKLFAEETSYVSGTQMTTNGITIVKLGAVANDTYLGDWLTYPQFHGFLSKQTGTYYQSNYMASYIYITNIAVAIKNSTTPTVPSYLSSDDRTGIDTYLTTTGLKNQNLILQSWSTLLNGNTTGVTNRALFVYGMALHTVTDLFAHSTYNVDDSYISHGLGADVVDYVPNRNQCAHLMAQKLIAHIKAFESGDISDFYDISDVYDGSFYMGRYSQYAEEVDPSYYNTNSWFFDWVNIY